MRIETEVKLDFKDVLIRPKRSTLSTRSNVDVSREFRFRHAQVDYHGVPIIAANMDTIGTFEMARALDAFLLSTALHKHYAVDELVAFFKGLERKSAAFYSMGIAPADEEKFDRVMEATGTGADAAVRYLCIDVANGYTEGFVRLVAKMRERYPHLVIMAGNVATGEMTEELILSGADIVKVGIGPGSVCTTRKMTGVGYPQLSAIVECADAAHGLEGHICADGGCATPGDVAKAFGGGADFVMLGGMFAGHVECTGDVVERDGVKFQRFYGMSSRSAMEKYAGGVAQYRAPEGKEVLVPYRGPVDATAQELLGGVRSACTYVGARRLRELSKRTTFVRVSQQRTRCSGARSRCRTGSGRRAVAVHSDGMAPRRRCHRHRRPGGRVARAGQPHLPSRSRGPRRRICRRTPCRTRSRPPTARVFTAGSPRAAPCRRRRSSTSAAMPRTSRTRSPTRAGRATGRSSRSTTAVTVRATASRANASSSPMRCRSTTPSWHARASTPERIVVFGRSLGTALAARVAAERPVAGAVLVSPYDSLAAIGRHHYPWLPVSLLLKHRFDAEADARGCNAPMLAIVADRDTIIPVDRSRALYDAWGVRKLWQVVPGVDHNSLGDTPDFWQRRDRISRPAVRRGPAVRAQYFESANVALRRFM